MLDSMVARIAGVTTAYRLAAWRGVHDARQGPLVLVEHRVGGARLRCTESHADTGTRCLRRQAWLLETVAHARGTRATVREERCMCAGEPACEYVVSWCVPPRVAVVVAATIVVAVGVAAAVRRDLLPPVAWLLVPVLALAAYAAERARCAPSVRESSAESGAAFRWLLGRVAASQSRETVRREAEAPAPGRSNVVEPDAARHPGMLLMTQEGEFWRIEYHGQAVLLRHSRGLALLAHLVRCPGQAIHVRDLDAMTPSGGSPLPRPEATDADIVPVPGDSGDIVDRQALAEYRRRMGELRAEIEDAETAGDAGRAESLRAELDVLASEVRSAVGMGGRVRRVPPEVERLRTAITRRIRSAIVKIAEHHPKLGAHLEAHVSTGYTCAYEPGDDV